MDGAGGALRPPVMDNAGSICRSLVIKDMDDKENCRSVQVFAEEETAQTRRCRKGGGSNLRKSLAWDNAFFTDEGVLNPMELSLLSGSATRSRQNFLSGINGESASPFMSKDFGSKRSGLHSIEETFGSKSHLKSQARQNTLNNLLTESNSSVPEGPPRHSPGKTSVSKTAYKSMLRPPTANSQKRLANSCQPDLVSKIPKIKGGESAIPVASKNLVRPTKCSIPIQHVSSANRVQNEGTKDIPLNVKRVNMTPVLPSYADSQTTTIAKHASNITLLPRPPLPTNSHGLSSSLGSGKVATSSCQSQSAHKISQDPSSEYAKPSALRMPSPSLGFFLQGKKASSNQILPSKSNIQPFTKPYNQKSIDQSRTLSMSYNQLVSVSSAVTNKAPAVGLDERTKNLKRGISGSSIECFDLNLTSKPTVELRPLEKIVMTESSGKTEKKLNADNEEFVPRMIGGNDDNVDEISKAKFPGMPEIDGYKKASCQNFLIKSCSTDPELNCCNDDDAGCLFTRGSMGHVTTDVRIVSQGCSIKKDPDVDMGMENLSFPSHVEDSDDACIIDSIDNITQLSPDMGGSGLPCSSIENAGSFLQVRILENVPKPGHCDLNYNISSDDAWSSSTVSSDFIVTCQKKDRNILANDQGTFTFKNEEQTSLPDCQPCGSEMSDILPCIDKSVASSQSFSTLSASADLPERGTQHDASNAISATEEGALSLELVDTSRKNIIPLKCQLKAEPFSDEWIAAVEAFGEDILKMKTGAVQNSPTEKALPEPSPWSPVKKKIQDVGPYDCTKYTKSLSSFDV